MGGGGGDDALHLIIDSILMLVKLGYRRKGVGGSKRVHILDPYGQIKRRAGEAFS